MQDHIIKGPYLLDMYHTNSLSNIVTKIARYGKYARGVKNCVLGTSRFKIDLDEGDG